VLTLFVIGVGAGARAGIGAGTGTAGRSKCVSLSLGLYVDGAGCIFAIKLEVNMSVILALVGVWHPDCGRGSDNSSPAIALPDTSAIAEIGGMGMRRRMITTY